MCGWTAACAMAVAEAGHLAGREGGQRVGDRSVAVLGGVLVAERRDRVRVATEAHQLGHRAT
ncbi:MAG: hypothetical protein ACYCR4_09080 [Acidimicrobiales bacterium]